MISPPIKTNSTTARRIVAISRSPHHTLLNNVLKWQKQIELLREENWFFRRLLRQAESISQHMEAKKLRKLRKKLVQVESDMIEGFEQAVMRQHQNLRSQKNSKYPPVQLDDTYQTDQLLQQEYQRLRAHCDELKRSVFQQVDDFLVIGIY